MAFPEPSLGGGGAQGEGRDNPSSVLCLAHHVMLPSAGRRPPLSVLWRSWEFRENRRGPVLVETPRHGAGSGEEGLGGGSQAFPHTSSGIALHNQACLVTAFYFFFGNNFLSITAPRLHPLLVTGAREVPFLLFPRQPSTFAFQMLQGLGGGRSSLPLYPGLPHSHSCLSWHVRWPSCQRHLGRPNSCTQPRASFWTFRLRPTAPNPCLEMPIWAFGFGWLSSFFSWGEKAGQESQ